MMDRTGYGVWGNRLCIKEVRDEVGRADPTHAGSHVSGSGFRIQSSGFWTSALDIFLLGTLKVDGS